MASVRSNPDERFPLKLLTISDAGSKSEYVYYGTAADTLDLVKFTFTGSGSTGPEPSQPPAGMQTVEINAAAPASIALPVGANVETGDFSATATPTGTIEYSVAPTTGVSIDTTGKVTVTSAALERKYTVTATISGTTITDTAEFTVAKAASVAQSVEVTATPNSVQLPIAADSEIVVAATAKDQYGADMTATLSVASADTGVVYEDKLTEGKIVVKSTTAAGKIVVKAVCGSKEDTAEITVVAPNINTIDVSGVALKPVTVDFGAAFDIDYIKTNALNGVTLPAGTEVDTITVGDGAALPTTAGVYDIKVTLKTTLANTVISGEVPVVKFTINKIDPVITITDLAKTFNGQPQGATVTVDKVDAGVSFAITYTGIESTEYNKSTDAPTNAGSYEVKVEYSETDNYKAKDFTAELVIAKAAATSLEAVTLTGKAPANAKAAKDANIETLKALLPTSMKAYYGTNNDFELVTIVWSTTDEWNAKGGEYKFTGTPESSNLTFGANVKAGCIFTITPVTITLGANAPITAAKATIEEAVTFADIIGIPVSVVDPELGEVPVEWNETLDSVKARLAEVTETNDVTVTLTMNLAEMIPAWATVTPGNDTLTLTITNKTPVDVVLNVDANVNYVYGQEVVEPTAFATEAPSVQYSVTYVGTGDTVYDESTEKPVNAGTYKAIVAINDAVFAGAAEQLITINPAPVTVTISNIDKPYLAEVGELEYTIAGLIEEDEEFVDAELSTTATAESDVIDGGYAITFNGLTGDKAANYVVEGTVADGVLTVTPLDLAKYTAALAGDIYEGEEGELAVIGGTLTAAVSDVADGQYDLFWNEATEAAADYSVAIKDSNKEISVVAKPKTANYTGETAAATIDVEKYIISGNIATDAHEQLGEDGVLSAGDTITVSLAGLTDALDPDFSLISSAIKYEWTLDEDVVADTAAYTVAGDAGVLAVRVYFADDADFGGEIALEIGEIGLKPITGELTLTESEEGVLTLTSTIPEGQATFKWLRVVGEEETELTVEGNTYEITEEDLGADIFVVAVPAEGFSGYREASFYVEPLAPSDVEFEVEAGSGEIAVTIVGAKANGSDIIEYTIYVYDAEGTLLDTIVVEAADIEDAIVIEDLENGEEYTIVVTATNDVDESVPGEGITAEPVSSRRGGGGSGSSAGVSSYTVTFDSIGGSEVAKATVLKGQALVAPAAPEKEGFVFDGWYTTKSYNVAYDFEAIVNKSFTLYAKWIEEGEVIDPVDPATEGFADVPADAWFAEAVDYAVENGLFSGVSENSFAPDSTMTRAMLVTVLWRAAGEPEADAASFIDVDADAYYAPAVAWAKANGIVNGVSETEFAPNAEVLREQITAILHRFAEYKGFDDAAESVELTFADKNEISEYAIDDVQYVVANGYMNGKDGNKFAAKAAATRAEVATILQRFLTANAVSEAPAEEVVEEAITETEETAADAAEEVTEEVVEDADAAAEAEAEEVAEDADAAEEVTEEVVEDADAAAEAEAEEVAEDAAINEETEEEVIEEDAPAGEDAE